MILDNSASMYYPPVKDLHINNLNKIGFGVLAIAALMNILKKQRDAVGLSIYAEENTFYVPEKSSERHFQMLLQQLNKTVVAKEQAKQSRTYQFLHQIAEKLHRRSLVFFVFRYVATKVEEEKLFEALRHLKYNKHEVVLFHLLDGNKEMALILKIRQSVLLMLKLMNS